LRYRTDVVPDFDLYANNDIHAEVGTAMGRNTVRAIYVRRSYDVMPNVH
jgi:hypothetical protein